METIQLGLKQIIFLIALGSFSSSALYAQEDQPEPPAAETKQDEVSESDASDKEDKEKVKEEVKKDKKIKDLVKDHEVLDGIFKLYRDPKSGALTMAIREDQLDKDYIYFSHIADGVTEGGHFRGQYMSQKVIKLVKYYNRIEFIQQNPYFYFDPASNLSKAKDANISTATLSAHPILASDSEQKIYLINVDDLFKSEALDQVKPTPDPKDKPGQNFQLGKLSSGKSKISEIHNYPKNLSVLVNYVYSNPAPLNAGSWFDITDARNVTVKMQHTLIAMPENDYKPRYDDPRVGYFIDYVNDMTSPSATPWRDMIHRWNLVKKNPSAKLSEPVEPIVWWIENTTPEEIRPIIKDAAEAWNIAFEAAGFKNALQVKIQPDDAGWDAGDIRYNVLRWTSSPRPPFGGYGPSFTNPRTGQILGADIMLEYSFLTRHLTQSNVFEDTLLETSTAHNNTLSEEALATFKNHEQSCQMANHLQLNNMLAHTLAMVIDQGGDIDAKNELVKESIYYLILHELGHTLGLNHNMKATQARSYSTAHDIEAQSNGLAGSVMDYPAVNFAPRGKKQSHYYSVRPGDYDIWAIQFGYDPDLNDPVAREKHLAKSTDKALAFGNDADDMRAPGKGIDPRVNIYDMTDNAIQYAEDRLKLDAIALSTMREKLIKNGEGYQELRNAYLIVTNDIAWQGRVISRYIGGIYVDRAVAGQEGATAPYTPVEIVKQRQAMRVLRQYIFAPDAFMTDPKLLQHIAIQRRGFFHYSGTEDPKIHSRAGQIQADILNQILHPRTLMRIVDSSLYGNNYSITDVMRDLTSAVFDDDARGIVNSFRQELQIMYVNGLVGILKGNDHDYIARSNAFENLNDIRKNMARWRGDAATRAHRDHISFLIDKALEVYHG
ncbi:zinc-dependent metalloprotease [Kordiimonas pumila]|uniref:Zinc-dependent metalloprotease n=1 Tax=Kordiimonas pumila TaxID=2161677 RepID=A0ABV7D0R2_9PROT|nr:zinc-dependent metalloprotease [Kordiimonas pumila]